jgi:GNAT superfamily N-acetyltransferase
MGFMDSTASNAFEPMGLKLKEGEDVSQEDISQEDVIPTSYRSLEIEGLENLKPQSPLSGRLDSKLGKEIMVPFDFSFSSLSRGSRSVGKDYCQETECTRVKRDMTNSKRAKNHLYRHGLDLYGRQYSFFPKTMSFTEIVGLMEAAYLGSGASSTKGDELTHWVTGTEPDESYGSKTLLESRIIPSQIQNAINHEAIIFGIKQDEDLMACITFQQIDPTRKTNVGVFKRFVDVASASFAYLPNLFEKPRGKSRRSPLVRSVSRAQQLEDSLGEWHSRFGSDKPYWYLVGIAVAPDNQGHGLGAEIVTTFVKLADRYNMDIYLECGTNVVAFFSKFDFEILCINQTSSKDSMEFSTLDISIMIRRSR